eukprot:197283_1
MPGLVGFADADYTSDVDQRRSVAGYIFTCNDSPIAWKSKRQPTTATSTSEAEYMALCDSCKEAIVLSHLLSELTHMNPFHVIIHEDSRAASLMAKGESSMKRSKHVDVRYHFIKDSVQQGKIVIEDVPTRGQLADTLTKVLPCDKHQHFVKRVMGNNEG